MTRRLLIAANWKMNPMPVGALDPGAPYFQRTDVDVVVFPMFLDLHACAGAGIVTGAQCGHHKIAGAFTGDVSMGMIAKRGIKYVLCGHSERRKYHGETDKSVARQVRLAIEAQLHPVVCVGEEKDDRDERLEKLVIRQQLTWLPLESGQLTIAYEPVWAIGKDAQRPATAAEAQEMHHFIRSLFPKNRADETRIIYGGNLNAANAQEILSQNDIDGGLVGGASLRPDEYGEIVKVASRVC